MTFIDVVAGIIFNDDRTSVLLALRKPEQHQGGLWEFPGGKQEPGENQQAALERELLEEIAIQALELEFRRSIEHTYDDKAVRLHFWNVLSFRGEARGKESQVLKWVPCTDLSDFAFPAANQPIVDELFVR